MYVLPQHISQQWGDTPRGLPGKNFVSQFRRYLERARRAGGPACAEITVDSRRLMLVEAHSGNAIVPGTLGAATEELVIAMAGRPSAMAVGPLGLEHFQEAAERFCTVPMMPMLWSSVLQAYRGRSALPPLKRDSRLLVTRMPKRAVLAGNQDHFRICAMLLDRSATVAQCASALDIDSRQVQVVFNAAYLTGYASREGRDASEALNGASRGTGHLASERLQLLWRRLCATR